MLSVKENETAILARVPIRVHRKKEQTHKRNLACLLFFYH